MRLAVVFDTPYSGWGHPEHEAQMEREVAAWKVDEPEMEYQVAHALRERGHQVRLLSVGNDLQYLVRCREEWAPDLVFNGAEAFRGNAALAYFGIQVPGFVSYRLHEKVQTEPDLKFALFVMPLQADGSAGIAQASVVQDFASLAERVAFVQERFGQGVIAEEFVDGRELYVSVIGNDDAREILPIIEMVFDKRKTRPEERIATRFAKWDEAYRERKGIRNVIARPTSKAVRERIWETCRTAYRALWLRDYARLDLRLTPDGQIWVLEANANPFISYGHDMANSRKGGNGVLRFHPAHRRCGDSSI